MMKRWPGLHAEQLPAGAKGASLVVAFVVVRTETLMFDILFPIEGFLVGV
jgi:hypothetical protein